MSLVDIRRSPGECARRRLGEMTPDGMTAQIDISLTDDYPLAQAIVIISAVPGSDA